MADPLEVHIKKVQTVLDESPIVLSSTLATEIEPEIPVIKIKGTAFLIDTFRLEFFIYLQIKDTTLSHHKYRFQLLNSDSIPIIRWDNAPHHPEIQSFPYHRHNLEENEVIQSKEMNMEQVLKEITKIIAR